jgi:putative methionine-R-sulfoxide reductase with GAF domain
VLIGNFRFKAIWEVMAQADVIGSGIVYMIDHDGLVLAHANPSVVLQGTRVELPEENAFTAGLSGDNVAMARTHIQLNQQDFDVIAEQPGLEALSSALNNIYLTVGVTLAAMVLAGFLGVLAAGQITNPIGELAETAQLISKGDLTRLPTVNSQDEIGALSTAFRIMTTQLRSTLEGLEQRVAARTRDLATVAEVGTATATILEIDNLLLEVVNLTRERFNLYHSHIYLLDEKGENLVLTAGAGEPGRIMAAEKRSIPLHREQSLVARAAREQKGVIVNDVTQAPDFLPNPLLPDTRSELAVPMIVGGNLIGVFDVQSDQIGRFTDADINIQTTLAAQVATSIQNVRSFEQSKAQADLESLVNTIGQKIQRATTLEDTLQIAIRELGSALGASRVSANIQAARVDDITGEN